MIASLLAVGALTVGVATYAYQWNPGVQNPNCNDLKRHAAVEAMFEKWDYDTFKELFADKWVARRITTQSQFEKFVELRKANLDGDTDKVAELRAELNLWQRMRDWSGMKKWMRWNWEGRGMWEHRINK